MNTASYSLPGLVCPRPEFFPSAPREPGREAAATGARPSSQFAAMIAPKNVARAWERVRKNQGAPGIDGITVGALKAVFEEAWGRTQAALEAGDYRPLPVRRVEVPKPGGGSRTLGIPAVMDRVVQQALAQILAPAWETRFSSASFAYRPGRGAHGALAAVVQWMEAGGAWAAHLDIEAFFDRVDQARLTTRLATAGLELPLVELVRQFLAAGAIAGGLWQETPRGTPQGSPLSPLLANIVLDGLDCRLEALGARHVRYADDLLILGRTRSETEAMVENAAAFLLAELHLQLNEAKTRLTPAHEAEFLGFRFRRLADGRWQRAISPAAQESFRAQVNALTEFRPGVSLETLLAELRRFVEGWQRYFTVPGQPWAADPFQSHARARVRRWLWQSWATPARRMAELKKRGLHPAEAEEACRLEPEAPLLTTVLGQAVPNAWFSRYGLGRTTKKHRPPLKPAARNLAATRRPDTASEKPAQNQPAPSQAAPPTGKRRGWFFNFSIGRLFTFRFLSENAPGVLARPEPRAAAPR